MRYSRLRGTSSHRSVQYLRAAARFFHVQVVPQVLPWRRIREEPKVAIYQNRAATLLHSFLHICPATAALVFIIFNIKGHFVGDVSATAITAIQFAAKILEIFIQTSLASMLLNLIRHQALASHGLPLGTLLAPRNTASVSYLWSLELWGSLTSSCLRVWRKLMLGLVISATIVLAALVGPSSAVLMIPRPIRYLLGRNLVFLDDAATLFPKNIESVPVNISNQDSIRETFYQISRDSDYNDQILDDLGARPLATLTDSTAAVSLVGRRIAYALNQGVSFEADATVSRSLQPIVASTCTETYLYSNQKPDTTYFIFGNDSEAALKNIMSFTNFEKLGTTDQSSEYANLSVWHTILWQAPPTDASAHSALFAEGYWGPDFDCTHQDKKKCVADVYGCTIDAYWVQSSINLNYSSQTYTWDINTESLESGLKDPISISPEWAEKLTSLWLNVISRDDQNGFNTEFVGRKLTKLLAIGISDAVVDPRVCAMVANYGWKTLKESPENISDCFNNEQSDSLSRVIKETGLDKKYDDIYFSIASNWTDAHALTQLEVQNYVHGYGYNSSNVPIKLSLAVLTLYCLIVVLYVTVTLITGRTASSWDSIAELVMLGVNSRSPAHLGRTSVGIDTLSTFREPVSIRVNERDSVELVFNNDVEVRRRTLREVEPNVAY